MLQGNLPVLDQGVVEVLQGTFTISRIEVVDVGVAERSTSNGVTADSDAVGWQIGGKGKVQIGDMT